MVSSDGSGNPSTGNGQLLYAKEFRIYSTTPSLDHGGSTNVFGNQVGIGTTSPSNRLHIYNTAAADVALLESTQTFSTLAFKSSTNSSTVTVGIDGSGNAAFENKLSSGGMNFVTNGSTRAVINSSGTLSLNAAFITGGYFNSQQYTLGSIATSGAQWVKICGVASPCQFQVKGFFGTNASEEQFEINVKTTYYADRAIITCSRQSYSPHISEVRVEGSNGGEHILYVKFNSNGYAGSIAWRVIDSSATPYIYNTITTPVGANYKTLLVTNGERVFNTTEAMSLYNSDNVVPTIDINSTGTGFYNQIFRISSSTAGSTGFNLIQGNNSGGECFKVAGNGNVYNTNSSYGATSDIKLKENIVDTSPKLNKLLNVRVVNYNLKADESKNKLIGVVAQELEEIFPGMVEEVADRDSEGNDLGTTTKGVKYSIFVPMLIKAVQELTARVKELESK
jgi:hypothetical protein